MMRYLYSMILLIMAISTSYAQDYVDPEWISTSSSSNVRSVNVSQADIQNQQYWCYYTIDQRLIEFMDNAKRAEFQEDFLNVGNEFYSCAWMGKCNKAWEKTNTIIQNAIQASKGVQYLDFEALKQYVNEYNVQAEAEGMAQKEVPVTFQQLLGQKDEKYRYLHIPLEEFKLMMKKDCLFHQLMEKIEIKIDPDLSKKSDQQDQGYVSALQYASGMFRNMHYRFVELQQNHILFSYPKKLKPGKFIYDLENGTIYIKK